MIKEFWPNVTDFYLDKVLQKHKKQAEAELIQVQANWKSSLVSPIFRWLLFILLYLLYSVIFRVKTQFDENASDVCTFLTIRKSDHSDENS